MNAMYGQHLLPKITDAVLDAAEAAIQGVNLADYNPTELDRVSAGFYHLGVDGVEHPLATSLYLAYLAARGTDREPGPVASLMALPCEERHNPVRLGHRLAIAIRQRPTEAALFMIAVRMAIVTRCAEQRARKRGLHGCEAPRTHRVATWGTR